MLYQIFPTAQEIASLCDHIRDQDRQEVLAVQKHLFNHTKGAQGPRSLFDVVSDGVRDSMDPVALVDRSHRCVAILGVSHGGEVWMLCAKFLEWNGYRFHVLSAAQQIQERWFDSLPALRCLSMRRNRLHGRWLQLLGFTVTASYNLSDEMFDLYTAEAPRV